MVGQTCILCKVFGIIAVIGLLNLGIEGLTQVNYLEQFLVSAPMLVRILYVVMGISGLLALLKCFGVVCPGCKKA